MNLFALPSPKPDNDAIRTLRAEVRSFLRDELSDYPPFERARSWMGFNADFSRKLGAKGWLGVTWPHAYGGHGRSQLERFAIIEELLAAGAPVAAHWIADRQSGPTLLRFGSEDQKRSILPRIAAGECFFCIGMSEPNSGSDLAAAKTRARPVDDGFVINGTKLWTTYAHKAHYMILFCQTGEKDDRYKGMSQLLMDLTTPGISINPIINMSGEHEFNEVVFEDVFVPKECLIGQAGDGWKQVTSELSFERSGPERFLSSFIALEELIRQLSCKMDGRRSYEIGRLISHLIVLRRLSRSVAGLLESGEDPAIQACLVKDLGATFEQLIPEMAVLLENIEPDLGSRELAGVIARTALAVPGFSLRGGTREILRGVIARGLGLR